MSIDTNFDIDEMDINQLKDVLIMFLRLIKHEHDQLTALQERVLQLETKIIQGE
jgi:hypothetical protein